MLQRTLLLLLVLCPAVAAADDFEVLARGTDGQAQAATAELETQASLDALRPGLTLGDRTAVVVHLGEQPQGTALEVTRVVPQDKFGLHVDVRLAARAPAVAKHNERPFLIVAVPRAMRVTAKVRMTLILGDAELGPMALDAADRTRARLAALDRSQRRRVTELSLETAALRAQVYALEREIHAYQDDDAYEAAVSALPFRERMKRVVGEAAFRTDLQLFGTTLNPLWTRGDENLKYLPLEGSRAAQSAEFERGYAEEQARLTTKLDELSVQLREMHTFANDHATQGAADVLRSR